MTKKENQLLKDYLFSFLSFLLKTFIMPPHTHTDTHSQHTFVSTGTSSLLLSSQLICILPPYPWQLGFPTSFYK